MPLPSILQLADVILAGAVRDWIAGVLPCPVSCFEGAVAHTQPLDIAHGLSLAIEKGLDDHSQLGIAQADVQQYYDSLNVVQLALWLHHEGMAAPWAAAIVRLQMLPVIYVTAGECRAAVGVRSAGSLTGSRVAGALGRIPLLSVANARSAHWERLGYKINGAALTVAFYVDNMYSLAHSAADAVSILEDLEQHLLSDWSLRIKPSSRSVCVPRGGQMHESHDESKWPVLQHFPVLGHVLDASGSSWPCWQATKTKMWRAFFANCVGNKVQGLPFLAKTKLLGRCVLPVGDFRCTRWTYHGALAADVDRQQRKMMSIMAKIPRRAGELDPTYFRRRHREISFECKRAGLWSLRHSRRVCAWNAHLNRPLNARSWAARLLHWHGEEWLAAQRLLHGTSSLGGRTGTRAGPGCPCPRWHDGVLAASAVLNPEPEH